MSSQAASAQAPRLRPRAGALRHAYPVLGAAAIGVYFALPSTAQEFAYLLFPAATVAAIVWAARTQLTERRLPLYLIAAGQAAFGAGDTIWDVHEVVYGTTPFPSVADILYVAGYPLMAAGIFLLVHRLYAFEGSWPLVDAAIVTTALGIVQWIFAVEPAFGAGSSALERAALVAYPVGDVLLIAGLARFFVTPAWRTAAYRRLLAGGVLLLVADELYALSPDGYTQWADAGWLMSYVLVGAAALSPSITALAQARTSAPPRLSPARLAVLGGALVTVPLTIAVEVSLGRRPVPGLLVASGLALAALVLTRIVGLVRALDAMRHRLEAQNERLRELDRLKDELVSSVGHDLRSPLVTISGFAELLGDDAATAQARRYADIVDRNAQRLLAMVDDLMLTARLRSGALELTRDEVDVAAEARRCVEAYRPEAEERGVELDLRAEPVPPVRGDRARLAQALENVVGNAVKFTPGRGTVVVGVSTEGGSVVVEVEDTGVGIPEPERDRVFDRFYRASTGRHLPGSGLGLHIVQAIVAAHGGSVSVAGAEGAGTTVRLELPAAQAR